jgi:hypothetical protein
MTSIKSEDRTRPFVIALVILMAIAAAGYRLAIFERTNYAVGKDAYFHIIQARSFLETGKTHAPDSSLTPYILAFTYRLAGNWETAQKVMLVFFCGLWTAAAGLFVVNILRRSGDPASGKPWTAILWALPAAFSPAVTLIASQFAKQSLGIAIFGLVLLFLEGAINSEEPAKRNLYRVLAGVAAVGAFFSHRLYGALALLGLVFVLPRKLAVVCIAAGLVMLVLGTFFLPGLIGFFDLERFVGVFSIVPSFHPVSMFRILKFDPALLVESFLPYAYAGLWIAAAVTNKKEFFKNPRFPLHLFLMACVAIGIFPFYKFEMLDMGYRLFIGFVPLAWLGICLLEADYAKAAEKTPAIAGLTALIAVFLLFGAKVYRPETDPPYWQYDPVITATERYFETNAVVPEILIVHHNMSFYYTYICGRHTLPFAPEWDYDRANTYRLAYGINEPEWRRFLPADVLPRPVTIDNDYALVREDVWQTFVSNCSDVEYMRLKVFSSRNPYEMRPEYLSRFRQTN